MNADEKVIKQEEETEAANLIMIDSAHRYYYLEQVSHPCGKRLEALTAHRYVWVGVASVDDNQL